MQNFPPDRIHRQLLQRAHAGTQTSNAYEDFIEIIAESSAAKQGRVIGAHHHGMSFWH